MEVALAYLSFSDSKKSKNVSWSTSVNTETSLKGPAAKPPITALAILPIPDCIGNKFSGKRPWVTSWDKNSIKWPAMDSEVESAGALGPVLSGLSLSTIAMTFSVSMGTAD